jgi:hypothetical protein
VRVHTKNGEGIQGNDKYFNGEVTIVMPQCYKNSHSTMILNCVPSADTESDWGIESAIGAGLLDGNKNVPKEL